MPRPPNPWKPGQSGNPGGRPKAVGHVRDLARLHTAEAIKVLAAIMKNSKASHAARVAAASALLDRAYGRPAQEIAVTPRGSIHDFSDDELASIAGQGSGAEGAESAS
jgi:hypothetical protein